ncbi:MAG: CoA transferase [Deltaproteobacteria bacterium]|nr:CoA transferase [Deltaproteobacteria bacterium]
MVDATPAPPDRLAGSPLSGVRVIDLSRLLPGPYASLVLADMGAEVIKIEAPDGGDYLRWMPPLTDGAGPGGGGAKVSWAFFSLNSGKRSLAVDLKRPEGAEVLRRLVAQADVLIESFRPGVMDRLGLGYDVLAALNPRLVYCAITGYGQTGPYRDAPGHDLDYMALAGALGLAGPADRPPHVLPVQVADIGGSLWGLVAILSALHARHATGRGRYLDISMTDGVTGFLTAALAAHVGAGAPPPRRGADVLTGGQAGYRTYQTKDGGFLAVAPLEPKFWAAFCQKIERPQWLKRQFDPSLVGELEALFLERTRAEWESLLANSDAMVEPVLRPDEVASHPLHVARGLVIETPEGLKRLRTPTRSPDAPPPGRAPGLGEDTRAILAELGYDETAVAALVSARVVSAPA